MFVREKIKKRVPEKTDDPSLMGYEYGEEDDEEAEPEESQDQDNQPDEKEEDGPDGEDEEKFDPSTADLDLVFMVAGAGLKEKTYKMTKIMLNLKDILESGSDIDSQFAFIMTKGCEKLSDWFEKNRDNWDLAHELFKDNDTAEEINWEDSLEIRANSHFMQFGFLHFKKNKFFIFDCHEGLKDKLMVNSSMGRVGVEAFFVRN